MSATQPLSVIPARDVEHLRAGRQIVAGEAAALQQVAAALGTEFSQAVELLLACRGRVVVTGMGHAGVIG